MKTSNVEVRKFIFTVHSKKKMELPFHWIPFQVEERDSNNQYIPATVVIWAYRNGNS